MRRLEKATRRPHFDALGIRQAAPQSA